jgi:hypothetical protein
MLHSIQPTPERPSAVLTRAMARGKCMTRPSGATSRRAPNPSGSTSSTGSSGPVATRAEAFVSTMCADPRRARLYAESRAIPALQARREDAVAAFTELIANDGRGRGAVESAKRVLMTRIIISGVTDIVTNWIDGTLVTDRSTLTGAIVTLGRAAGMATRL